MLRFIIHIFVFLAFIREATNTRGPWYYASSFTQHCFYRFLFLLVVWFTMLFFWVNLGFWLEEIPNLSLCVLQKTTLEGGMKI
jgi:hypothetical protein